MGLAAVGTLPARAGHPTSLFPAAERIVAMRCVGVTRAGRRCTLTADSNLRDDAGRLVAGPLRRGGPFCVFHAMPCQTIAAAPPGDSIVLVFFLDLETTGIDVGLDRVVEIAATQAVGSSETVGVSFATTVHVERSIFEARGMEAIKVHGISAEESAQSPSFPEAWSRFVAFVADIINMTLEVSSSSSGEEATGDAGRREARPAERPPSVLVAAHNGIRFDFAVLLFECYRHRLSFSNLGDWFIVDTLSLLRAVGANEDGHCLKLQCMTQKMHRGQGLRAHRALDDCIALRSVLDLAAARLDCSLQDLLLKFVRKIDIEGSLAQVSTLFDDSILNI